MTFWTDAMMAAAGDAGPKLGVVGLVAKGVALSGGNLEIATPPHVDGDLLVWIIISSTAETIPTPTGLTSRFGVATTRGSFVFSRVASSEPETRVFGGAGQRVCIAMAVRGFGTFSPMGARRLETNDATTIFAPSISRTAAGMLFAVFWSNTSGALTFPSDMDIEYDGAPEGSARAITLCSLHPSATGASGDKALQFAGNSSGRIGLQFQLS